MSLALGTEGAGNRNGDLERHLVESEATLEQFELLRRYLLTRHADGGMAEMTWPDYVAMVEDTAVRTHLIEYRSKSRSIAARATSIACVLVDVLADGLSLVYSFYDPDLTKPQPGLVHHPGPPAFRPQQTGLPYVYLGYWVPGSEKMAYKARFSPLEILKPGGWALMSARERGARHAQGASPRR